MKSRSKPSHQRHGVRKMPKSSFGRVPTANAQFDVETGQVYDEVEVVFQKKHGSDWIGEFKTPSILKRPASAQTGSRSLADMARSKCVSEFRNFTTEHFELIPWSLGTTLWDEITLTHSESFHMWRTLAATYNGEEEFANLGHRYHLDIRQSTLPIQGYFRGISSSNTAWVSALRISPKQISVPDLVAVAHITNLTVLDLSDGQLMLDTAVPHFDERIMRTWAELAAAGKAFKHLQVLMLGWQDSVSSWIFGYLDHFPHLRHVITTDCRNMHQKNRTEWEPVASAHGWMAHHAKKSAKLLRPLLDDREFHVAAVSSIYYREHDQSNSLSSTTGAGERQHLPLVECWVGTPRRWTHILDEFPGARTIWFEKAVTKQHESIATGTAKREWDRASPSQGSTPSTPLLPSPQRPRKRYHGGGSVQQKISTQTVASLLADMSK